MCPSLASNRDPPVPYQSGMLASLLSMFKTCQEKREGILGKRVRWTLSTILPYFAPWKSPFLYWGFISLTWPSEDTNTSHTGPRSEDITHRQRTFNGSLVSLSDMDNTCHALSLNAQNDQKMLFWSPILALSREVDA